MNEQTATLIALASVFCGIIAFVYFAVIKPLRNTKALDGKPLLRFKE